ncbi:small multi-drug export protein [Candidatus Peregrinibacteria bacterium]|jgi:uncharacterized membrane protein|nr:small multi-drug export protein [Candidatus Peregrinibacteria bacterium]MBT4055928.1 small multi-drug export protein [Candidatus Peregrinibacteria bacterium]
MDISNLITPETVTFFGSMVPGTELRLAIPVGIGMGLSPIKAFIIGVIGNLIPNFIILWALGPITKFLRKHSKTLDRFFEKLFEKTRNKHRKKFAQYGSVFIVFFVSIPLPGSGSWTGSLIAFLFGVKYWKAIALISIGVIIAGILVTTGFEGAYTLFNYLTA